MRDLVSRRGRKSRACRCGPGGRGKAVPGQIGPSRGRERSGWQEPEAGGCGTLEAPHLRSTARPGARSLATPRYTPAHVSTGRTGPGPRRPTGVMTSGPAAAGETVARGVALPAVEILARPSPPGRGQPPRPPGPTSGPETPSRPQDGLPQGGVPETSTTSPDDTDARRRKAGRRSADQGRLKKCRRCIRRRSASSESRMPV